MASSIKTIYNEFPLETIQSLFDNDKFYIKLFKDLLYAVTNNNDFTYVSNTPGEIKAVYQSVRKKVEKFIMDDIYENLYTSRAYDNLIVSLIDIYSVMYTVIYLRTHITDINIQPDEVVDAYLDMFNFHCKELFNYIQRREICKVVYWYLRRKGTPSLIIKLLNMLGFSYFFIAEFEICNIDIGDTIVNEDTIFEEHFDKHVYRSRLLHEQLPEADSIGFYYDTEYLYTTVKNEDPLAIKTDQEVSNTPNMTFPAQSPYYQVGVVVTYTLMERIISAFTYAMLNKTYMNIDLGEDVFTSTVKGYNEKVSFISLILGYTYIFAEYFGVHDTNLYEPYTIKEAYDKPLRYDIGRIPSKWRFFQGTDLFDYEIFDGGFAYDEFEEELNGGNAGFIIAEYDGLFAGSEDSLYQDEVDGEFARVKEVLLNGGSDINAGYSTSEPDKIAIKFNDEKDGGYADSFPEIEDNRIDTFFIRNGFTYAKYDFGELSRRDIPDDMLIPNNRNVYDRDVDPVLYDKDGNLYDAETAQRNIDDDPENNILYKLKYPVFGWQKPVMNLTPLEIMNDINKEVRRLSERLKWQPDILESRLGDQEHTIVTKKDNIKTRRENALKEIYDIFYGKPIYTYYDRALASFIDHDNNFKTYIDSIILTKEERLRFGEEGMFDELANNFDDVLELLNNILESVEYYIFNNTSYIIPVRNLVLSYDKIMEIIYKLDRYYTPYHARLLFPLIVWMIRDLPGDQVALEDSLLYDIGNIPLRDVVWRANHYNIFDVNPPEPYSPIEDWKCNINTNLHIPISNYFLDEPYYDREAVQKNNNSIFAIGYDWTNLEETGFIVRGKCLQHIWDWDPDLVETHGESILLSGFDIMRPDHERLKIMAKIHQEVEDRFCNFDVYTCTIFGDDKHKIFQVNHYFTTKDVFVNVYDLDDGFDIECHIQRKTLDSVLITFNDIIPIGKSYRVIVVAPLPKEVEYMGRPLTGGLFNIVGNDKMKHFLFVHNLYSDDSFIEVYDKYSGENVGCGVRRFDESKSIVSFNLPPGKDRKYRVNTIAVFTDASIGKVEPQQPLFMGFDVTLKYEHTIQIDHHFYTNNLITRVYDRKTNEDVDVLITHLNPYQMTLDFQNTVGSGRYRIIMMGTINKYYGVAVPLNNITGYSGSFFGDSTSVTYNINHGLNSINTFEQVFDADTGELVKVLIDRVDKNNITVTFNEPPNSNRDFIVHVFAEMNPHSLAYPSTPYNTFLKQFIIKDAYRGFAEYNGAFGTTTNNEYTGEINGHHNFDPIPEHDAGISTTENITTDFDSANNEGITYSFTLDGGDSNIIGIIPTEYSNLRISGGYAFTPEKLYMLPPILKEFKIKHDINNRNVTVQVYNQDNVKIECSVKVLDENNILLSLVSPINYEDTYYVNVLSLPDTSIPFKNIAKKTYDLMFIDMYHESLPIADLYRRSDEYIELDGGFASTLETDYEYQFNGGTASIVEAHYRNIIDGGYAYTTFDFRYDTFSVNHNLGTQIVMVNVFDENTGETIDVHVAINDDNWVTVGFKNPVKKTDKYHVVVIGALPADNIIDEGHDVDCLHYLPPHHYREFKTEIELYRSVHMSTDRDFWDQTPELVRDPERENIKYNLQKFDLPVIMERVNIIHEIMDNEGNVAHTNIYEDLTEIAGFNEFGVITNDPLHGKEAQDEWHEATVKTYRYQNHYIL